MVFQLLEWNILVVNDTLLGDPPKDSFLVFVKKKKKKVGARVEGLGGVAKEITLFLSDHFKMYLFTWCDDSCF